MSYLDVVAEDQRLRILQALEQDAGYSHNEHVLRAVLASVGHNISRDVMRGHLSWLEEQGLIELEHAGSTCVAKLKARGEDVALGRTVVPGIARRTLD